jgi:signal transduction histidine kinase
MVRGAGRRRDEAVRLERGLIRIRWFGVGLALYLVSQSNRGPLPHASSAELGASYAFVALLAAANVAAAAVIRRPRSTATLERLGLAVFAADILALVGLSWAGSYDPAATSWAILYVLPLEGAIRYGLAGALAAAGISFASELVREAAMAARFAEPDPVLMIRAFRFQIESVVYRVGLEFVIALVAGLMARSLARERALAEASARSSLAAAAREASARAELAALNTAILSGVAAEDLDPSLQAMAESIGAGMDFERFVILLREGDALVEKGLHASRELGRPVAFGEGVTGHVAQTRVPLIVPDVGAFAGYLEVNREVRSEMAAPMRIGDEVIGVLDVTSSRTDAFGPEDLTRLVRLADQFALVAHSTRLLSQQRETMARLEELDQMKSDFVAITSHELRTPITAIRGYTRTLLDHRDRLGPEQSMRFLATIDRQSGRLARLVEDLLVVSRIEAGSVGLAEETVPMKAFLSDLVEGLGEGPSDRVRVRLEPPEAVAVMDPHRVEQIVRNLVENALKFSDPTTTVVVSVSVRDSVIEIAVADRGMGIDRTDLERIFERFQQAGPALTRGTEGAGLGLYITKRLVQAMGGTIDVTSLRGEGSVFIVRIPEAVDPHMRAPDADRRAS